MNCKPGDLVILINTHPDFSHFRGWIATVKNSCAFHPAHWDLNPPLMHHGIECSCADRDLRPIRDNPGNEQFVTDARNKLKGKTEITERGELA